MYEGIVVKRLYYQSYAMVSDESGGWYAEKETEGVILRSRVYANSQSLRSAINSGRILLTATPVEQLDRSKYEAHMTSWIEHVAPASMRGRHDLLPVFREIELLETIIQVLTQPYKGKVDYVAAPESVGWILGTAIARDLDVGFVAIRKGGKLPYEDTSILTYDYVDCSGNEKQLAIVKEPIPERSKVLVVDGWIKTGTTVQACIALLQRMNCVIVGITAIGVDNNSLIQAWLKERLLTFIIPGIW